MSRASICASSSTCADGLAAAAKSAVSSSGGGGVTSSTNRCRVHPPAFTTLVGTPGRGTIEPTSAAPWPANSNEVT